MGIRITTPFRNARDKKANGKKKGGRLMKKKRCEGNGRADDMRRHVTRTAHRGLRCVTRRKWGKRVGEKKGVGGKKIKENKVWKKALGKIPQAHLTGNESAKTCINLGLTSSQKTTFNCQIIWGVEDKKMKKKTLR